MKPSVVILMVSGLLLLGSCAIFGDPDDVVQDGADVAPGEVDVGPDSSDRDMGVEEMGPSEDVTPVEDMAPIEDMAPVEDMGPDEDMKRPDCTAQVAVASLQAEWTTPNNIYWSWDWINPDVDVREFEMVVGRSAVDVEDEVNVRVYTADDNGEFRRTTGEFPVDWTVTWDHEPDREYFAKLVAYDQDWCHAETAVASATTMPDVTNEHVVFSESPTEGFSVPDGVTFSNRHPYEGQFAYEWEVNCDGDTSCFDIVRRGGFVQSIANWDPTKFEGAFVEYAWHNEGNSFAQYPAVRLAFNNPDTGETEWYKAEKKAPTGPSAGYRLHQVPLRFMWREGDRAELTPEVLDWDVREFGVGASCDDGTFVTWDEVRIRW